MSLLLVHRSARRLSLRQPRRLSCDGCNLARIQGVVCHETGCHLAWWDPETEEAYPVPCWQCGYDYVPEGATGRYRKCPECANPPADDECDDE